MMHLRKKGLFGGTLRQGGDRTYRLIMTVMGSVTNVMNTVNSAILRKVSASTAT